MKKLILALITIIGIGCSSYIQVIDTASTNTEKKNGNYIFENDSLKITYNFWAKKGLMTFSIYNKLETPLYVDWKKSSHIDNSVKLNYWIDKEVSASIHRSYYYLGPLMKPDFTYGASVGTTVTSSVKAERITFIPPSSNYFRSQFYILPISFYPLDVNIQPTLINRVDKPHKTTEVYEQLFSLENSPLIFRNFLTLSYSENFETEFYVDNEFYIKGIREMNSKGFGNLEFNDWSDFVFISPFRSGDLFYLDIPKFERIKLRKRY